MGSSEYRWEADEEVLMNSAILGAPGANLPRTSAAGAGLSVSQLARRRAVFRWHRRTTQWEPLWLDSSRRSLEDEPATRNWGRVEPVGGKRLVPALALRVPSEAVLSAPEPRGLRWTGHWILFAQGNGSIFDADEVVLIPLAAGTHELPCERPKSCRLVFANREEASPYSEWRDGVLTVEVKHELAAQPILGFHLRR